MLHANIYLPKPTIDDEFLTNIHRIHRCLDINQVAEHLRICVGDSFNRQKGSPTGIERSPVVANISWISNTYASHLVSSAVFHMFFLHFSASLVFLKQTSPKGHVNVNVWLVVWVGGSAYHQPFTDNRIDDVADVFFATNSHYENVNWAIYLHGLEPCLNTLNPVDSED